MPRILLVDDSTFARMTIRRQLGDGFEFIEAASGLEGLEAYFLHHPDLVILDITMPDMSGLDVLKQIRDLDAQARVIICSADVQEFSRSRSAELGARGFIGKPVTVEVLCAAVQAALDDSGG